MMLMVFDENDKVGIGTIVELDDNFKIISVQMEYYLGDDLDIPVLRGDYSCRVGDHLPKDAVLFAIITSTIAPDLEDLPA